MKKLIILFCFLVIVHKTFAQIPNIDSMLNKAYAVKDENLRFDILSDFFDNNGDMDPLLDFENSEKLLTHAQNNHDGIGEAIALNSIGYDYKQFGNFEKGLDYLLQSVVIAEKTGNDKVIVYTKASLGYMYRNLAVYPKAVDLLMSAIEPAVRTKYNKGLEIVYQLLGETYLLSGQTDSALIYAQKDYELSKRINYYTNFGYTLLDLGRIHFKMRDLTLAMAYCNEGIQYGVKKQSAKLLSIAYTDKAQYFTQARDIDSILTYAKKAVEIVQNTPFTNYSLKPAKLLLDIYRNRNGDSAFKYSEIYRLANDSLFNTKAIQQTQLMTFENEQHQQQLAAERAKAVHQRKQNIQFALIALGIITFIVLFLLFTRSIIANERLISFFGILGLLVVFEFINLFIHPWLASFTNESPVLMLLALVLIAALLIPLHHRLEKWIKEKMTEKNKAIRLAAAKKTIRLLSNEKLENK